MTVLQRQIAQAAHSAEMSVRAREYVEAFRLKMLGKKAADATRDRAPSGVVAELSHKAAVPVGTLADNTYAGYLAPTPQASAFMASLRGVAIFDTLKSFMLEAPLRSSMIAVTGSIPGTSIAESSIKPHSRLSLTANALDPNKVALFVAVTREVAMMGGALAQRVIESELTKSCVRGVDSLFLSLVTSGATSVASSGQTVTAVRQDLRTLLANVETDASSKLFLIVPQTVAEAWATIGDAGGVAFPDATVNGGSISGMTIIPSDVVTAGEIILIDAAGIAVGDSGLTDIATTDQATLSLFDPADSPISASTVFTSLWQMNMVAARTERWIAAKAMRTAVAKITGASYTGGSP
jgi:hypothetical protein